MPRTKSSITIVALAGALAALSVQAEQRAAAEAAPLNLQGDTKMCRTEAGGAWTLVPCAQLAQVSAKSSLRRREAVQETSCPADFDLVDGSCYRVTPQPMTWIDAELYCEGFDAHLAAFADQTHFDTVATHFRDLNITSDDTWIGLHDITVEGNYEWADGSTSSFRNWATGQPDNQFGNENCGEYDAAGQWKDAPCSSIFSGVCKWSSSFEPMPYASGSGCTGDFVYMYDGCYKRNSQKQNWLNATFTAVEEGAMLASIHSEPQNRWIAEHLRRFDWLSDHLWMGLNDIGQEGTWEQADGSDASFKLWGAEQPDGGDLTNCVHYDTNTYWYDEPCDGLKYSLIKASASPVLPPEVHSDSVTCPAGYQYMYDGCYKKLTTAQNWFDAGIAAVDADSELAAVVSGEQNRWLATLLDYYGWLDENMWMGLNDISKEGEWAFSDGSVAEFTAWGPGQPETDGTTNCAHFDTSSYWYDEPCLALKPSLVKYNPSATYMTEVASTTACPTGFTYMYDGCYKKNTELQNWFNASIAAVDDNAMLASIHSEAQNRWLWELLNYHGMLTENMWIGLNDIGEEGTFEQADGSEADYVAWGPGEPGVDSTTNCVHYDTSSFWYDEPCFTGKPSLIKYSDFPKNLPEMFSDTITCTDGYIFMYDGCYKKYPELLNWFNATFAAVENSGSLASIHSVQQNRWLATIMQYYGLLTENMWIGLNDIGKEGTWEYADGSSANYFAWADQQPDVDGTTNCVHFDINWGFYDEPCSVLKPSLLRYNTSSDYLPELVSKTVECPEGFTFMFDGCYMKDTAPRNWINASYAAMRYNATLASIHTEEQNRWLFEIMKFYDLLNENLWIGLNDIAEEGTFVQADGSETDYEAWGAGNPTGDELRNCAQYGTDSTWVDEPCRADHASLFKWVNENRFPAYYDTEVECQPGFTQINGRCYAMNIQTVPWENARNECLSMDSELATITAKTHQRWIVETLRCDELDGTDFWIGLNDQEEEGEYSWISGDDSTFRYWNATQPSNLDSRDCVVLLHGGGLGQWMDVQCNSSHSIMCMEPYAADETLEPTAEPTAQPTSPEEGTFNSSPRGAYHWSVAVSLLVGALAAVASLL